MDIQTFKYPFVNIINFNSSVHCFSEIENIDGYNLWNALSKDTSSERNEILHNIDDIYGNSALTIGQWKIVKGTTYGGQWDNWYGPAGNEAEYNSTSVISSLAGKALAQIHKCPNSATIKNLREKAKIDCNDTTESVDCKPLEAPCLFNVLADPCEKQNLAEKYPAVIQYLEKELSRYNETAVPPGNLPLDPKGDPRLWNYVWTNFGDYSDPEHIVTVL